MASSPVGTSESSLLFPLRPSLKTSATELCSLHLRLSFCSVPGPWMSLLLPLVPTSAVRARRCVFLFLRSPVNSSHQSEISKQESNPVYPLLKGFHWSPELVVTPFWHDILGLPLFICGWVLRLHISKSYPGCTYNANAPGPALTNYITTSGVGSLVTVMCSPEWGHSLLPYCPQMGLLACIPLMWLCTQAPSLSWLDTCISFELSVMPLLQLFWPWFEALVPSRTELCLASILLPMPFLKPRKPSSGLSRCHSA